ncbi:WD40-repeat-containing domain protein [Lentinula edodes]|uniref:WD40-repeat-containing domain protein n=1 Tax=Lentinula edodes TaxID=5353 RepID=UPI001E8E16A8|nr:WD40-repeat-containing domain protein [Lentinula edodes]KAH7869958.1 WD40-repeat-containing domain protein [Lentinula edodes]
MASSTVSCSVVFTTQTPYPLPSQKYMIPTSWKRFHLSQLINKALALVKPIPFDFLVKGELLKTSLGGWCTENNIGEEETLEVEYIESVMPPQKMSDIPHDDWVSSVSCQMAGYFYTASYDGHVRLFDYSQKPVLSAPAHSAPITSLCLIPESKSIIGDEDKSSHLIATSSHDLCAQITRISLPSDSTSKSESKAIARLYLHTAPVSSIASNSTGTHLLTSSWDTLIGVWDTTVPTSDEVPEPLINERERKKRRKLNGGTTESTFKRKAPTMVLKSHTARVSRVVFGNPGSESTVYSCGFDSTVRLWDVENGVCTHTITSSEKPFVDIALNSDGHTALAASTDRTVTLYDVREASSNHSISTSSGSLVHTATPSCLSTGATPHQVFTGAYDGVVRLWDLRSMKSAITSFKAWDGMKKVLSIDWKRGMVGIGGEGGFEVWKVVEDLHS